jgi:hypothetical protein
MLPTFNVDHSSSWCSNDIGLSFAQLWLGCRWVDALISSLTITEYISDTFRCGTRGVDCRRYIWRAHKPCGKLDYCSQHYFLSGISAGHVYSSSFPRVPLEKGAILYLRSAIRRILWCWCCLCQLLSCHRHSRRWAWYPDYQRFGGSSCYICRAICALFTPTFTDNFVGELPDPCFMLLFRG